MDGDELTPNQAAARPDPRLLRLHLIACHDLIPLNRPDARRGGASIGKAPLQRSWQGQQYSTEQIINWMTQGHNIGVRLREDQLVIDVDPRNFKGSDRLEELCEKFCIDFDDYPCVYTGGGGRHIYMSKPPSLDIRRDLEGLPGIEFKSHGSQVVAAGSVHPDTKIHYRAVDPFNDLAKPKDAPEELLRAIAKAKVAPENPSEPVLSPDQVRSLLAVIDPTKYRKRDDWLELMMAAHHASSGLAADQFVAWAISDPQYADHEAKNRETWDSLNAEKPNGITVGTLFRAVRDAGRSDLVREVLRRPACEEFPDELDEWVSDRSRRRRFQELSLDELSELDAPKWLVHELIPDGGLAVVYGQPKSCKTFWALDLALSVATGRSFHGVETRPGRVTYVAAEGGRVRLGERALAWKRVHRADRTASWKLVAERVDLTNEKEVTQFIAALDGPRELIVIDTLARCMSGDENSQKDMGAFVAGCDRIREATGAAVLVVHHEGKDAGKGARGSNVLRGALDTSIRVRKEGSGAIVVSVEDQRDAEPLAPAYFTLQNVPLDGIERASAALALAAPDCSDTAEAILAMAVGLNGASKGKLDELVAERFKLSRSTALRRTREAIKEGRERASRYHGQLIWFERAHPENRQSGLVLNVEPISDVSGSDVEEI
jgi:hypothetical protein